MADASQWAYHPLAERTALAFSSLPVGRILSMLGLRPLVRLSPWLSFKLIPLTFSQRYA